MSVWTPALFRCPRWYLRAWRDTHKYQTTPTETDMGWGGTPASLLLFDAFMDILNIDRGTHEILHYRPCFTSFETSM